MKIKFWIRTFENRAIINAKKNKAVWTNQKKFKLKIYFKQNIYCFIKYYKSKFKILNVLFDSEERINWK